MKLTGELDHSVAYDGLSKRPQDRELTPLERDILTRILGDILHSVREGRGAPVRVHNVQELELLADLQRVLDPRED